MRRIVIALGLVAAQIAAPAIAQDAIKGESRDGSRTRPIRADVDGTLHIAGAPGSFTDGSSTLTTAATSQIVFAPNPDRRFLMCENPVAATEILLVGIDETANPTTSIEVAAGGSVIFMQGFIPTGQVTVRAATVGHRFICKQG